MRISGFEKAFKEKYPYAREVADSSSRYRNKWTVYAGDYICTEAYSRAEAYRLALEYVEAGLIQPDPLEQHVEFDADQKEAAK